MLIAGVALALSGCGYNDIQQQGRGREGRLVGGDEPVPAPRRPDPEPRRHGEGLRAAGAGGADAGDRGALAGRQIQVTPETLNDPAALQRFQQAQGDLTSALSRLLVVVENYPELKSDENFRDLQAQLEGTENRIAVARNRYIKTVQDYNVLVREFPVNLTAMVFGYKTKPNFTVENEREISRPRRRSISASRRRRSSGTGG